jgi:hypothetical protein
MGQFAAGCNSTAHISAEDIFRSNHIGEYSLISLVGHRENDLPKPIDRDEAVLYRSSLH